MPAPNTPGDPSCRQSLQPVADCASCHAWHTLNCSSVAKISSAPPGSLSTARLRNGPDGPAGNAVQSLHPVDEPGCWTMRQILPSWPNAKIHSSSPVSRPEASALDCTPAGWPVSPNFQSALQPPLLSS